MKNRSFVSAWLSITYDCNNRCLWCYSNSSSGEIRNKIMTKKVLDASQKLLKDLGVSRITLIGGEPTMYHDIEHLISSSRNLGFNVGMVSNGRLFSSKKYSKRIADSGLAKLTISIEGSNSEMHDSITQVDGSFIQSRKGIENCLNEGICVSTESTVSYVNKNDLLNLVGFLSSTGIKMASFNVCGPCLNSDHSYTVKPSDAAKMLTDVYLKSKEVGLKLMIVTPQPLCNFDREIADELVRNKVINSHCFTYYGGSFVLDYNGDVNPCVHYSGFPFFNIKKNCGEYMNKDEFLNEFWKKDGIAEKFRDKLWTYPSKKCIGDVNYGKTCLGGCPLFWFKYNPDDEIRGIVGDSIKLYGGANGRV